ncbi:Crotonobetainyl-CoA:carnitine CoA-transferase CaiB [Enhydrobacter aerosaccus]|uniref:Crotonobetainyl-CoA:carnitine CoA-transferase CaiB n=1 Tax=Enhydrobacter aerosaccus TaxID=225324 RepID=A0A1T4KVH9_9HYPH|nr:CoA transferase [Enhydrobacter aerosaccus]SJZ46439.1 Crotonobetainyl-CoA:carnitine CoA-transferase CaiB [Enhydrobacter aerosaccus]
MSESTAGGPLAGVKVVDLTTVVVGPICTRTLADYGADVIKVEAPGGDLLRTMAEGSRHPGMSGKFINFNRNKRSIVLDLKKPEGHAALLRLIRQADVFVSNVRPEALARAGLDHASLAAENPRLIHCSILAFGRGGRYFNRPAYDPVIQSLSGVAGTLARATGEPRFVPMVMSDHVSGLIAAQCIGFALYRREKTGQGEAIDVPMLENMASFVASEHLGAMTFDPPVGPSGDGRLLSPDYRPLPTKDGYITVRPNTNAQAFAFFDAIGRPELKTDPRFDSAASRTRNARAYFQVQREGLGHKTTDEWVDLFDKLDVPAARYNSIDDLLTDPHLKDVGFFGEEDHPTEGKIRRTRLANTFSGGQRRQEGHAPLAGQHTREILAEIGYSEAEIDKMLTAGSVMEKPGR